MKILVKTVNGGGQNSLLNSNTQDQIYWPMFCVHKKCA